MYVSLSHANFKCTSAGLVINPLYPHLGASPNGLISCDCYSNGVIEIKCPYSGRECHPKDLRGKLFLNSDSNVKHSHKYYTQVHFSFMNLTVIIVCQWLYYCLRFTTLRFLTHLKKDILKHM